MATAAEVAFAYPEGDAMDEQQVELTQAQHRFAQYFARWMRKARRHGVVLVCTGSRRAGMTFEGVTARWLDARR